MEGGVDGDFGLRTSASSVESRAQSSRELGSTELAEVSRAVTGWARGVGVL